MGGDSIASSRRSQRSERSERSERSASKKKSSSSRKHKKSSREDADNDEVSRSRRSGKSDRSRRSADSKKRSSKKRSSRKSEDSEADNQSVRSRQSSQASSRRSSSRQSSSRHSSRNSSRQSSKKSNQDAAESEPELSVNAAAVAFGRSDADGATPFEKGFNDIIADMQACGTLSGAMRARMEDLYGKYSALREVGVANCNPYAPEDPYSQYEDDVPLAGEWNENNVDWDDDDFTYEEAVIYLRQVRKKLKLALDGKDPSAFAEDDDEKFEIEEAEKDMSDLKRMRRQMRSIFGAGATDEKNLGPVGSGLVQPIPNVEEILGGAKRDPPQKEARPELGVSYVALTDQVGAKPGNHWNFA